MSTSNSWIHDDVRIGVRFQDLRPVNRDAVPVRVRRHLRVLPAQGKSTRSALARWEESKITQAFLFGVSVYIADRQRDDLPHARPQAEDQPRANIVLSILYIVSIAISADGGPGRTPLLSVAESALLLVVIWYAWTSPQTRANPVSPASSPARGMRVVSARHGNDARSLRQETSSESGDSASGGKTDQSSISSPRSTARRASSQSAPGIAMAELVQIPSGGQGQS